jgi:hydrogenase/urease accessory protein HupE
MNERKAPLISRTRKTRIAAGIRPDRLALLLAAILSWMPGRTAQAHDARPLSITIAEQARHLYRVERRVPPSVDADNQPGIHWPSDCRSLHQAAHTDAPAQPSSTFISCAQGIEGRSISIHYALFNPSISTLIRMTALDGTNLTAVLPPEKAEWIIPLAPSRQRVAWEYLLLGIKHIWTGFDHLLFVAGLLILAGTGRRILFVITGFTIAHSITLSLSALHLIDFPVIPTEASISLSILFLAHEIGREKKDSLAFRFPLLVSSTFGLLHGLGFAAALGEIGLPANEITVGLLFFNLGVELGQIGFIVPVLGLIRLATASRWRNRSFGGQPAFSVVRAVAVYGIGIAASYWLIERLARF